MGPVRRSYVDLAHGQVHVRTAGSPSDPVVLLLHQVPSSSAMFEALLEPLAARGLRPVAIDLPGYGMSDPLPVSAPELSDYAGVVREVLGALAGPSAHAVVFGHHTGGDVALTLAATYSEVTDAVALWGFADMAEADLRWLADEPAPVLDATYLAHVTAWWHQRLPHLTPGADEHVIVRALGEYVAAGVHQPDGHNAVGRTDHLALLRSAKVPVLFLTGSREMLDEVTRAAHAAHPDLADLVVLGDAGMDVVDDHPDLVADTLARFFRADAQAGRSQSAPGVQSGNA